MTITMPWQGTGTRRAIDEVARLRHQLAGAGILIQGLRLQVADAETARDKANAKAGRYDEAEARAAAVEQAMDDLKDELLELRAFKARTLAVTVPAWHRDIDPGEQPTEPIDVRSLTERFATGPVRTLHQSPQAVSPTHFPVCVVPDTDTVELPVLADQLAQGVS
ncbi:hypothetical protein [Streptomyces sp. NPDC056682]|uniref:hypothetical protein n=1 Tax=Streptomyces sp. NPDC056682 TaxID=3345909 RepID=UPI0036947D2E